MTTMFPQEIVCGLCGEQSSFMEIGSTNCFGPSDLDTRPAEMQRSTMPYWVQRCPHCGYCMENVETEASEAIKKLVGGKGYKDILQNERLPELSNVFHCNALIHTKKRNLEAAFWSYLHAAWTCDDESINEGGKLFRKKAIETLEKESRKIIQVSEDPYVQETIRVDLYRRVGEFESADRVAASVLENELDDLLRTILDYERWLIAKGDDAGHNVQEAVDYGNSRNVPIPEDDDISF